MWTFAAEAAVHVYNIIPHKSNNFKVPLNLFAPRKEFHFNKLVRFSCISYTYIPKQVLKSGKFEPVTIKTVILGYSDNGYELWDATNVKF